MLMDTKCWSAVLSFLAQQYLMDSHATCILWHESFDVQVKTSPALAVLLLDPQKWSTLDQDSSYERRRAELEENNVVHNEWILHLTLAIERSHCESFIAFQEHIPQFAQYFYNASNYAIWRSRRNHFIFVYTDELLTRSADTPNYFDGYIFHDQPNILVVNAPFMNSTIFEIKTNRFVGPRYFGKAPKSVALDTIQRYDAKIDRLIWDKGTSMTSKMRNLQGREIVIGLFDYKPFMVVDYERRPNVVDQSLDRSEVLIDGTEIRLMLIYCELHNCTVRADTSEKSEWGDIYANYTGIGLMGMVLDRRVDYIVGGLYIWYKTYRRMDLTQFLGRSGVTCLVPAPHRIINWALPLRPFQTRLWICVLFYLLLEVLALAGTRQWERLPNMVSERVYTPTHWKQSLRFGFVSTLKLLVNQSTDYVSTSYALRTVLLASYMIDIILTTVYGGGLAAILTLPKLEEAADSRQRLYEHKLIWSGTSYAWVNTFDVKTMDPVLLGLVQHFRVFDADALAINSRTEQMGFVVERMQFGQIANAEMIPDDALTRLKLMIDDIYFTYTTAYVSRLWAHLEEHSQFVLAWHSSGFDKYWEWRVAAEYMNANRQNRIAASQAPKLDIGPVKLGIDNFIGVILVWCFGVTCSLLAFVAELCCLKGKRFQDHTL